MIAAYFPYSSMKFAGFERIRDWQKNIKFRGKLPVPERKYFAYKKLKKLQKLIAEKCSANVSLFFSSNI
jgi:hypothetical protein